MRSPTSRFRLRTFLATISLALTGCMAEATTDEAANQGDAITATDVRSKLATTAFETSATLTAPVAAPVQHPDYLAMNVPFAPAAELRAQLDAALGLHLKNRGEAHITVVSPPEAQVLSRKVSIAEIDQIAAAADIQHGAWDALCVGVGSSHDLHTFYVVARAPHLVAIRRTIAERFRERGGRVDAFDPDAFEPHVTLGFTKRDLFDTDGVHKSVASCPRPDGLTLTE